MRPAEDAAGHSFRRPGRCPPRELATRRCGCAPFAELFRAITSREALRLPICAPDANVSRFVMDATVSAGNLRVLISAARKAGVDVADLLSEDMLAELDEPDGRVSRQVINQLWEEIPARLGNPAFGLEAAEALPAGVFGAMDYAAHHAPDARGAICRFVRYCRLIHETAHVYFVEDGQEARLGYAVPGQASPRHANEFVVSAWVFALRRMTGRGFSPDRVRFSHAKPSDVSPHRRVFRVDPVFGQEVNEITLDQSLLASPVVGSDPSLGLLLDRYAEGLLARLPADGTFVSRARQLLAEGMTDGDPTVEMLARRMGMSPRSLQRRLQDGGTSFQELLDSLRKDLALRYLENPAISIGEATFLLGYSEPSAFHRAFRRWTGTTPKEYRAAARRHGI